MAKPADNPYPDADPWLEQLSAYHDGELPPHECAEVERRLAADPHARRLLAEWVALRDALHATPRASAPRDLRQAVLESTRATPAAAPRAMPVGRSRRGWVWAGLAIAAAAVLMLATPEEHSREVAQTAPQELPEQQPAAPAPGADAAPAGEPATESFAELRAPAPDRDADPVDGFVQPPAVASDAPGVSSPATGLARSTPRRSTPEGSGRRGAGLSEGDRLEAGDLDSGYAAAPESRLPSPARERPTPLTAEAVVVRLALRPSALKSNFVDGVLNANGILIEPTPASLSGVLARRQRSQPPAEANSAEESPSRDNQTTPLEIMLVDSPIPPVVDVVSELNRDLFNCVSIDVKGVGADTPPAAYNTYQQRVIDNRAAAASLGVYARGVGKHRSDLTQQEMGTSFKGKRQSASPPPERLATKPDRLADPGGVPRGLAYKLRPVGDLDTQDERRLYEQLGLLANQAVLHNRRVGQDRAAGRTGGLGGFGGAQADLLSDASELRLPVVLVCEPAADAPPRDAAPPQDDS